MKIEKLELTNEEMNQAIQRFLDWKGMKVKVESVETKGYPRNGWRIELDCETDNEVKPTPVIKTIEELGTAIEAGVV